MIDKRYGTELINMLKFDDRVIDRYRLISFIPDLQFEKTTKLKELDEVVETVAETFDSFKAEDLSTGEEVYVYYGDFDSFGVCNLKTLMKKVRTCIRK